MTDIFDELRADIDSRFGVLQSQIAAISHTPTPTPTTLPTSADGALSPPAPFLVDGNHDWWSITTTQQAAKNGVADPTTSQVVQLLWFGGSIYAQTTFDWFFWNGATWVENFHDPRPATATPSPSPAPAPTPAPAGFTPASTTGLELWFDYGDGATVTTVSGAISQVNDKTAHAHNATQGTAGNRPTYAAAAINSLAVARYDSTFGKTLTVPHATAINDIWTGGATVMAVLNMRSAGGGVPPFSRMIDKGSWYLEFSNQSANPLLSFVVAFSGATKTWSYVPGAQWSFGGGPFLVEIDYDSGATTNDPTVRINGVPLTIAGTFNTLSGAYLTDAAIDLSLGGGSADGDMGMLAIWPATLSTADRTSMRSYVSTRWNIAVATSGTPSTTPGNPNTPAGSGGSQPATAFDLASAAVPTVTAQQGKGWSCVADYTFGTGGGCTITNHTLLAQYFFPIYNGGVNRLNDEWEFFVDFTTGNHNNHIFNIDCLTCRVLCNDPTLFDQHVARCLATTGVGTPDGHDWGSFQGNVVHDCGVQSGMVRTRRTQRYGYIEWKSQCPPGTKTGWWPADWMIDGGPNRGWPPEVDVKEQVCNNAPDNSFNTFHNVATSPGGGVTTNPKVTIGGLLDGFGSYHGGFDQSLAPHIYAVFWEPGDTRGDHWIIYVDQVVVWEGYYPWQHPDGSPAGPAEFISDHAYGGNWAGRGGAAANRAQMPIDYKLYWIRHFAK